MVQRKSDLQMAVESHKYRLKGIDLINVTAISGLIDGGKSAGMAGAAAKLTREGANYRDVWKAKADDGTRRHNICEAWLTDGESFVTPEDQGFVDGLEKFWIDNEPVKIECEAITLSHHGYGGRFDMVVAFNSGEFSGGTLLVDLKTGKRYPIEHSLQLSAYRYADGIGVYDVDGNQVDLRPMPDVDACACLYIASDGSYSLVEYPADREAFEQFLNLLHVHQWTKSTTMKVLEKAAKAA